MMRSLFTEVRRSPGLFVFPLLAAATMAIVWQDADFWAGDWHATSIKVQLGNVLLGPFVSACAAWAAGRGRRRGHDSLAATMPRPQAGPVLLQWAAVTLWGLFAYLAGLGLAVLVTAPRAVDGAPWPSYILLGAAALCSFSAVGYALGRLIPWRIVAPLAGLAIYAYFVVMTFQGGRVSRLSLLYWDLLESPQYRLRTWVLVIALVWAAGLASVMLTAASTRGLRVGTRAPVVALAALPAAGAVLAAALLGGGDAVQRSAPSREVCHGNAPKVCVWPEHAKWGGEAADVARSLSVALDGVAPFPAVIYEEGLPEAPSRGGPTVRVNTIPVTPPMFVSGYVAGILPELPPNCPSHEGERLHRFLVIKAWMQMRATGQLGSDVLISDTTDLQALLNRSPSEQKTWVRSNLPFVTSCSAPLPSSTLRAL